MERTQLQDAYRAHVLSLASAYQAAMANCSVDQVVVHSGRALLRSIHEDQAWPLRPMPHFHQWAPVSWPDCVVVVGLQGAPTLLLLEEDSWWERPPPPDVDFFSSVLNVARVRSLDDVTRHLQANARTALVTPSPEIAAHFSASTLVNPPALLAALDQLRVHKSPYEHACLKEANRIAAQGHQRVLHMFEAGERRELELHLGYLSGSQQDDPDTPYKNIMALGEHAAILHHVAYSRRGQPGPASLLVDAGASFHGYASDITRTHVCGTGAAVDLFSTLLAGMHALQQAVCAAVRVGQPYEELHDHAHVLLARLLRNTGLVSMSEDAMVAGGVTRLFMPHGLGHSLGLQVHDVGCALVKPRPENRYLRNTRTVEPGQCFTVEPGFYVMDAFMKELQASPHAVHVDWKAVDALRPFGGIRIEDDVVVRPAGEAVDNLTRAYLP